MSNNNNKETISILKRPINYVSRGKMLESEEFSLVFLASGSQCITREFESIKPLHDDHYIVGNAVLTIDKDKEKTKPVAKVLYGIIRLTRDDNGKVIPYNEKIVVPFYYDRIKAANSKAVILTSIGGYFWFSNNPRYTYVDLDLESKNYGQQLLPMKLESAGMFDQEYEGFAKCRIYGEERYIPRNCEPRQEVTIDDLLDASEVEWLLHDTPKQKLKKLTGGCEKSQLQKITIYK